MTQQQQQQQLIASSSIKNAYTKILQHFSCFVWFLLLLLAATTVTTTTTIIITLNVNKATGNNGANCCRSIKKQKRIKRELATKNASKNARSLRIGVDYIDWINYIFITHSQMALKAAASASALIKFTQLWPKKKWDTWAN